MDADDADADDDVTGSTWRKTVDWSCAEPGRGSGNTFLSVEQSLGEEEEEADEANESDGTRMSMQVSMVRTTITDWT